MEKGEILKIFEEKNALLSGHFKLSGGLHSKNYLQCALVLQYSDIAGLLCKKIADFFKKDNIDYVVAPAIGGIVVSYEVARALGVRSIFTERKDSKMTLRRGFSLTKDDRVLVVEDVITTGLSTKEVIDVVNSFGSKVVGVASIVDRSGKTIDFGVKSMSLLKLDIPVYQEENCPLCKEGLPITKPGSR
ncbi:MAG: orotate phosphoribosyltransferase [Candidatus Omnitrophota bacterium]